ncbi:MAG: transglutaminase-like domain-containing protein [Mobilitalea sp.]
MNRKSSNGLRIDPSIQLMDEKKPGLSQMSRLIQFAVIFMGSWGAVSVFIQGFSIPVHILYVNIALLACTEIAYILCKIKLHFLIKALIGGMLYAWLIYEQYSKLCNGFYILENLVIKRLKAYYGYRVLYFTADYSVLHRDTTLLLIVILIPIVMLVALAVVKNKLVMEANFILLIFVASSFAFGITPSEQYIMAYLIAVIYLVRSNYSFQYKNSPMQKEFFHKISSNAAVCLCLIGIGAFLLLKLLITPLEYGNAINIPESRTQVKAAITDFVQEDYLESITGLHFGDGFASSGGLSGGKLSNKGKIKYNNTEELIITVPFSSLMQGIYLKGYVGSVYTGKSWKENSKEDIRKYQTLLTEFENSKFVPGNQVNQLIKGILAQSESSSEEEKHTLINEKSSLLEDTYTDLGTASSFVSDSVTVTVQKIDPSMLTILSSSFIPINNYAAKQSKMTILYKAANQKFLYAPYFTNYELLDQTEYKQDLYAMPKVKRKQYEMDYYFSVLLGDSPILSYTNQEWENLVDYSEYEKLYRAYVHQVYTKLPAKGLERIKKDFAKEKIEKNYISTVDKIMYVKGYLNVNTKYSLAPGKLPRGKEYVEYFLYENKLGYCAHYATAATLMLRAMGIPARYVEGYAVSVNQESKITNKSQNVFSYQDNTEEITSEDMVEISVRDKDAHAWVEVYIDGIGWIPVEFTPGSVIQQDLLSLTDMTTIGEKIDTISPGETTDTEPTLAPTDLTPTILPLAEQEINDRVQMDTKKENNNKRPLTRLEIVLYVLLAVFLISALFLTGRIGIKKIDRAKNTRNHNARAIDLFQQIEIVFQRCNILPSRKSRLEDGQERIIAMIKDCGLGIEIEAFDQFMQIARKARFGKGMITIEEMRTADQFYRKIKKGFIATQPVKKRIYLSLLLSI